MRSALITTALLTFLATAAEAENPLYVGVTGGAGMAGTVNTLINNYTLVGEFPTAGITTATFAGIVAGYQQQVKWFYWGAEVSAAYDFTRQCFSLDCAIERHPGALLREVGEVGVSWNQMVIAGRFGAAERTNNLCAFNLPILQRDCGSGLVLGGDLGAKLKFKIAPHADLAVTWDHIGWKGYSTTTPYSSGFQNSVAINHEEVFALTVTFH